MTENMADESEKLYQMNQSGRCGEAVEQRPSTCLLFHTLKENGVSGGFVQNRSRRVLFGCPKAGFGKSRTGSMKARTGTARPHCGSAWETQPL